MGPSATLLPSWNICVSMGALGKLPMRYTHQVFSLRTHTKEDGAHRVAIASMGVPKRLQMRDRRTKSAGVGNHRRVTVGSMGAPRNPQMRGTHQVHSLRTKARGGWEPPSGHGWVNGCPQEPSNERHAPTPQPAHKNKRGLEPTVGSRLAQSMLPGSPK